MCTWFVFIQEKACLQMFLPWLTLQLPAIGPLHMLGLFVCLFREKLYAGHHSKHITYVNLPNPSNYLMFKNEETEVQIG